MPMIDPQFLASLRQQYRAEMILVMVQLEQLFPCWHSSITELSDQLGTERATLNRSLSQLRKLGLIQYYSIAKGGCWIWWVKRHMDEIYDPKEEPGWDLRTTANHQTVRVHVSKRAEWAKSKKIPLATLNGFLLGYQTVLRKQWRVIRSPFDVEIVE